MDGCTRIIDTGFNGVLYVVLIGWGYVNYLGYIYPKAKIAKTIGRKWNFLFVIRNRAVRRTVRPPYLGRKEFAPTEVRLIGGGAEFPLGVEVATKLRLSVDFGKRYFHVFQGEWQGRFVMTQIDW